MRDLQSILELSLKLYAGEVSAELFITKTSSKVPCSSSESRRC